MDPIGALLHPRRAWVARRYEAKLRDARRSLRIGDYAAAAAALAPLYARSGRDPLIRWELSSARWLTVADRIESMWEAGDERAAVALAETAAAALPDEPEFPLWLGPAAVVHERFADAAHYAAIAARLVPDDPATLMRAASFGRWGDVVHARSCVETVKDLLVLADPDEPFALLDELPRLEAQLRWAEGDTAGALQLFRHAAAARPADQFVAADLAQALLVSGESDEAAEVLDDALRAFPGDRRLLDLQARARG